MTPKRKRPTDLTRDTVYAQKDLARVLRSWADDLEKGGADMDTLARRGELATWAQRRARLRLIVEACLVVSEVAVGSPPELLVGGSGVFSTLNSV